MPLSNVPETDTFTTNVQMPADGDPADASDFQASTIVPLTNRSRWVKTRMDELVKFLIGGTITMTANVVFTGFRLTLTNLTVAAGYLTGQSLRKPLVYAAASNPSSPISLNPITNDAVLFRSSSISGTTTLKILDDSDAVPVGYSVLVRNAAGQIVNVDAYVASGYSNVAVLDATAGTGETALIIKTETGPARWELFDKRDE